MTSDEILSELRTMSSEKYKANVVKLGIPEACSIGISTADVRKLAKKAGKDNALAHELWNTGYHEARLLAVLVIDKKKFTLQEGEAFMHDVISWDLCDHLCKNLLIKLKGYEDLIENGATRRQYTSNVPPIPLWHPLPSMKRIWKTRHWTITFPSSAHIRMMRESM